MYSLHACPAIHTEQNTYAGDTGACLTNTLLVPMTFIFNGDNSATKLLCMRSGCCFIDTSFIDNTSGQSMRIIALVELVWGVADVFFFFVCKFFFYQYAWMPGSICVWIPTSTPHNLPGNIALLAWLYGKVQMLSPWLRNLCSNGTPPPTPRKAHPTLRRITGSTRAWNFPSI